MSELHVCNHCQGFCPATASKCPHCGANPTRSRLRRLVRAGAHVATGGALAVTLMACYGAPMQEPMAPLPEGCTEDPAGPDGQCSDPGEAGDPMTQATDGEPSDDTVPATGEPEPEPEPEPAPEP